MAKTTAPAEPKPKQPTGPIVRPATLWGGCLDASLVAKARSKTNGTAHLHERCLGHTVSPRGDYGPCACTCHQTETNPIRCIVCKEPASDENPINTNAGPGAGQCIDGVACHTRHHARLAEDPRWRKLQEEAEAIQRLKDKQEAEAVASGRKQPRRRAVNGHARPSSGRCEHCGEPTKGGRFVAGHDAKLKGLLVREANGNPDDGWSNDPEDAMLELLIREWPTKSVGAGLHLSVHERYESTPGVELEAWLAQRVTARIGEP